MSFYIQHGYGKASKIQEVAAESLTDGVILSPADEDRGSLTATVGACRGIGIAVLLDPQSYIYSLTPAGSGRCHRSHGLDFGTIHWSADATAIGRYVKAVRNANTEVGITGKMIAPTCIQSTFGDVWTPLALQLARTAAAEWGGPNTLAALVVDEGALSDWSAIQDWLDVATTLDVAGFYLAINRPRRDYPAPAWDSARLTNWLRLMYNLSTINEYEVIWAFADIDGLVGLASGITSIASGWHYSLRSFAAQKWQPTPQGGGKAPAPRIYLSKMWASVRAQPEAEDLFRTGLRDDIFPSWATAEFARRPFSAWTRAEAQFQHLTQLARGAHRIAGQDSPSHRLGRVDESLKGAEALFDQVSRAGVVLPPSYRSKVRSYRQALASFAEAESL